MAADGLDHRVRRGVRPQVGDLEAVVPQDVRDHQLAQVMDVPLHGADEHLAHAGESLPVRDVQGRFQDAAHDVGRHQEVRDEIFPGLIALVHPADAFHQRLVDGIAGGVAFRQVQGGGEGFHFIQLPHGGAEGLETRSIHGAHLPVTKP